MDAYLAAAIGFVTAAVLAMVNSWLTGREKVAESVREQRIRTYASAWRRTSIVSRWPRTDAKRANCRALHEDLRSWYYGAGGLYLSTRARKRYEHLQEVLSAVSAHDHPELLGHYDVVMEAASYFRTGLTDDLQTRDQRNPLVTLRRWLADRKALEKARTRDAAAKAAPAEPERSASNGLHVLTGEEERIELPPPAS